jgi:hypothetical protein
MWLHGAISQETLKLHTRHRENLKCHINQVLVILCGLLMKLGRDIVSFCPYEVRIRQDVNLDLFPILRETSLAGSKLQLSFSAPTVALNPVVSHYIGCQCEGGLRMEEDIGW